MKKRGRGRAESQRRNRNQNRAAMIGIILVACLILTVLVVKGCTLQKKIAANSERLLQVERALEEENERTGEIAALQKEMKSDEYIERVAREKLGMVKENEILFKEAD